MRSSPDKALLMDINTINSVCVKYLGENINIFLYGSYGANQGGWVLDNKYYYPYNDYDILILKDTTKNEDFNLLPIIKKELLDNIQVRFIDLSLNSHSKMESLEPTVENFDIINASKQIFGNYDFRKYANQINNKNIPLVEVEKLFFTRLWVFSGAITNLEKDKSFRLTQIAKAVFAIVDAILIENKKYASLYADKKDIIQSFVSKEFFSVVCWAYKQRSRPSSELNSNQFLYGEKYDENYLSKVVCEEYKLVFLRILGIKYKKSFKTIHEFRSFYQSSIKTKIKKLIYPIVKGRSYKKELYARSAFMIKLSVLLSEISDSKALELLNNARVFFNIKDNDYNYICYEIAKNL